MSKDVHFKTAIAHVIGKNAAIFLNQCVFWQKTDYVNNRKDNPERNGWFYKSRDEWHDEILLSRYQQENARKKLRDIGLLVEDRERTNIGIRIWYRINLSAYYAIANTLPNKALTEGCKLTLEYDNPDWRFALNTIAERMLALYPTINPELLQDAVEGHLEYWMYRTDRKAGLTVKQLQARFLSREKGFLVAMNQVGQKYRGPQAEDSSTEQNDSTNLKESLIELSDCTDSSVSIDITIDTEYKSTIVPNCPYKAENGTIVSGFTAVNDCECSDSHCVNNNDSEISIENDESVEPEQSDEPVGSPLSENLSDCPDGKHSIDPEMYLFCHPFIYQFVCSCTQHAEAGYQTARELLERLSVDGFAHDEVQQGLFLFIREYGHDLLNWYQDHSPVMINPLNKVDIEDAIQISIGAF